MIETFDDLIDFLQRFHRSLSESPQLVPSAIPTDLPWPLAVLYRELGALVEIEPSRSNDHRAPFSAQDAIMPLSRLKRIDGMVEFACENQGNWTCRCQLGEPDPPVYSNAAEAFGEGHGFEVVCDSLSHFLATLALQEAVMSCPIKLAAHEKTASEVIGDPPPAIWLNGVYVFTEPTHNFYFDQDRDLLVMEYAGVWLGSHTDGFRDLLRPGVEVTRIQ